jgi:hypothetical protein
MTQYQLRTKGSQSLAENGTAIPRKIGTGSQQTLVGQISNAQKKRS